MAKAIHAADVKRFQDIPNLGPATEADLRLLGIATPADLASQDAWLLYDRLCATTGVRHDPCVIDVFLAIIDFMRGAPPSPWWRYTAQRKQQVGPV